MTCKIKPFLPKTAMRFLLFIAACGLFMAWWGSRNAANRDEILPEMRAAALQKIAVTTDTMHLSADGLRVFTGGHSGQKDFYGYTMVEFLFAQEGRCIAFNTRCKAVAQNASGSEDLVEPRAYQCIDVTWFPYDVHSKDCPMASGSPF